MIIHTYYKYYRPHAASDALMEVILFYGTEFRHVAYFAGRAHYGIGIGNFFGCAAFNCKRNSEISWILPQSRPDLNLPAQMNLGKIELLKLNREHNTIAYVNARRRAESHLGNS